MAGNIKGMTVEIGGNTAPLNQALKDVNKEINNTQRELNDVNRLLKLDPKNTELLKQKQQLLGDEITKVTQKLDALKQAQKQMDDVAKKGGNVNQEEYRKLQREIAGAEQKLSSLNDEFVKSGKDAKSASEGYTTFKNVMANLGTQAINATLNGIKKVGNTLIDTGKQALEAYADYEQLKGGVETLFKDSSKQVEEYASNAYKTAGISANQYMETVTSFSASLLQGLGGDTDKAAKLADQAIVDMADNANKMGTSIESIQNAYQGFAKGNFTMLDNLKLGYGGTKTEMVRLINDSKILDRQIKSIDEVTFDQMIEAIHQVQTNMGITGTTAKEASETISGSVNSMQSAWQNMLIGIADDNANFEQLIDNLIESIITVISNIMPRIQTIISGIGNLLMQFATTALPAILPQLLATLGQLFTQITQTLFTSLPMIIEAMIQSIAELATVLGEQLPTLIPIVIDGLIGIVDALLDNIDLLVDAALQLTIGLADGLIVALPKLLEKAPEIIQKLVEALISNIPKLLEVAVQLLYKLGEFIVNNLSNLGSKLSEVITYIKDILNKGFEKMKDVGLNLIKGLWEGIKNAKEWLIGKIKELSSTILEAIKEFFGIESPSKVMRDEVGKYMAEGIGVGFTHELPSVVSAMKEKLAQVTSALQTELSFGDIPQIQGNQIISENQYVTRNYTNTIETIRQPSVIELNLDGTKFARAVIPSLNNEYNRLGVRV